MSVAWLEPSTLSVGIYFTCYLLNGRGGARLLKQRFRKARDWGKDILLDEFSEFLCDHPELLLLTLLTVNTLTLVYDPRPAFRVPGIGIGRLTDWNGLSLPCSLPPRPGSRFARGRLHVRLSCPLRPGIGLPCRHCLRRRALPVLRDSAPGERQEEAVQDTG